MWALTFAGAHLRRQGPQRKRADRTLTWVKYIREELEPRSLLSTCCCTRSRMLSSCRKWTSCFVGCTLTSTFWGLISKLAGNRERTVTSDGEGCGKNSHALRAVDKRLREAK